MSEEQSQGTVQSDETLFDILDIIRDKGPIGVTNIAEEINKSTSTVHKHLKTLDSHNFVHNNDGTYKLGLKFLYYGGSVRDNNFYYNMIWPKVSELADTTNKLAAYQVQEGDCVIMLYSFNDEYNIRQVAPLGDRCLLHQSAAGQVILAYHPDEWIKSYAKRTGLPTSTEVTIDNTEELFKRIQIIRERGYTISHGERIEGLLAISAPVLDSREQLFGAVSLTEPLAPQSESSDNKDMVEPLLNTVNDIRLVLTNRKYNMNK